MVIRLMGVGQYMYTIYNNSNNNNIYNENI